MCIISVGKIVKTIRFSTRIRNGVRSGPAPSSVRRSSLGGRWSSDRSRRDTSPCRAKSKLWRVTAVFLRASWTHGLLGAGLAGLRFPGGWPVADGAARPLVVASPLADG